MAKQKTDWHYDAIIGTPIQNETDERLENEINKAFNDDNLETLQRHPHADDDFEQQKLEETIEDIEADTQADDYGNEQYEVRHQQELDSAFENLDKDLDEDSYAHEDVIDEENDVCKTQTEDNEETSDTETTDLDCNENDGETKPLAEVVTETAEEKRLLKRKSDYVNQRIELEEKNIVLLSEAEKFERLVSTMDSEPFIELKDLVKEGLKTYIDRDDDKEAQKKFNNFKAICQMQNLLTEYKKLAEENRQNITANENEIKDLIAKIDEIDSKLHNFQTKLDFDTLPPADAEIKTENVQQEVGTLEEQYFQSSENDSVTELLPEEEIPF